MIRTTPFYIKLAQVLISLICLGYIAIIGKTVISPLLFAFLFSLLLLPFAGFLERRFRMPRVISSLVVIIVLTIFILGVLFLLGAQLTDLAQDLPAFKQQILEATTKLQNWISETFHIDNQDQISYINSAASEALTKGTSLIGQALLSISSLLLFLMFIFLYTFFILLHRRLLLRFIVSLFHDKHSIIVYAVVNKVQYIVKKYILGLFIQMIIVTTLACIAFEIIGVKYGLLLGLITGIFNIIPYIGISMAMLLTILITFTTMTPSHVLFVIIAIVIIHIIDGNYIMPKIVGSKVKINTLIALLGLVIGEMMWGITGMFLSIPVIAIFKVVFDHVDSLKPWGMLLGEDDSISEPKNIINEIEDEKEFLEEIE